MAAGCAGRVPREQNGAAELAIPALTPPALAGRPLRVVTTTSVIGDVVARVGGEAIDLTVLLEPGEDSHSYLPGAQDLVAVSNADVIFVNGWHLEGALAEDLATAGPDVLVVPISAGIDPLAAVGHNDAGEEPDGEAGHDPENADPHVWFDLHNVARWVENAEHVLGALDPDNAGTYAHNAAVYLEALDELGRYVETQLDRIPAENRFLVTNHDSLAYFAHAYNFEIVATVIPAASTLAEPSAGDLAALIEEMEAHGVCTIFSETSASDELARTAAAELDGCSEVRVIALYTEALGPPGSGAETLIGMFTANVDAIVEALK
jgi:ABC-type Zn uptake system ZnuABC Zn-binding protein ZnuA